MRFQSNINSTDWNWRSWFLFLLGSIKVIPLSPFSRYSFMILWMIDVGKGEWEVSLSLGRKCR